MTSLEYNVDLRASLMPFVSAKIPSLGHIQSIVAQEQVKLKGVNGDNEGGIGALGGIVCLHVLPYLGMSLHQGRGELQYARNARHREPPELGRL